MKIKMISMAFSPYGVFEKGQILTDAKLPASFLSHLVNDAGAAEWLEYDTKVITEYETKPEPKTIKTKEKAKKKGKKTAKKSG